MKLWTPKFLASLGVIVLFLTDAALRSPDRHTGHVRPLLPYMDTGLGSFVFLIVVLYVLSHLGQWVLMKVRHRGEAPQPEPPDGKRKRRKR